MQVEPIKIINVDDVPYLVDDMSDTVKRLVEFYNEWRQKEADAKSDLLMIQAAMRDISREIIMTIRSEKEAEAAAAAEAEAPAPVEAVEGEVVDEATAANEEGPANA